MKYNNISAIDYATAVKRFGTSDTPLVSAAILSLALHENNVELVEKWCLYFMSSMDSTIASSAINAVGHLARIHGRIDKQVIIPALHLTAKNNPKCEGIVQDSLDDIELFCK